MIGMIIADDELLIRQGLQSIAWEQFGIDVRGVAVNGIEALSLVSSTDSRILLTDVRMPGMDGLKLIDAAKAIVPGIKAILLTGYQDFTYAQTALHLGAFGYILKPSNPDEIIQTVLKAKEQIKAEQVEKDVLLNSFMLDLIYGRVSDSLAVSQKCREFDLHLENFAVMVAEFGTKYENDNSLTSRLKEEMYMVSSDLGKVRILHLDNSSFCIVVELDADGPPAKEKVLSIARAIKDHLRSTFDIHITIGISKCFSNPINLYSACNQAVNCLKMKCSPGEGAIIHIEDLVENKVIKDVLDYIEKYYMNDISLLTVSDFVHMNHIYLSRLIKKETGRTFLDILTSIRMKKACEMLKDGSMKAYEVADMVGMKDSGYFSQVFKKYFGMTPSEYRESELKKRGRIL